MGQIQTIAEFLGLVRRRFALIYLVGFTGTVLAILYATEQPRVFEAAAVIQIETPLIAEDSVQAGASAAQRVQLIEQRLMVRENMLAIIARHGLFANLPGLSPNERAVKLREATRIEPISSAGAAQADNGRISALIISVRLGSAVAAAAVANDLAAGVLEQSAASRADRARQTLAFYEAEKARIGGEINALESRIAAYRKANDPALPESLDARRAEISRIADAIATLDDQISGLDHQRAALGLGGDASSGQTPAEQLQLLEQELAQARLKFIARSPEIQTLEARIAALKGASDAAQTALTQRQVADLTRQITLAQDQRAGLDARRTGLEESIRQTPMVQKDLSIFARDLQQLQDRFDATSHQRDAAEIAQRLETGQQAERFVLLEPAVVPEYAIAPSRRKLVVLGAGASLGAALALAFLLELLHPAIRTSAQLERAIGIHPVIAIPDIPTPAAARRRRWTQIAQAVLAVIGLSVIAALLLAMRLTDGPH